MGFIKMWAKVRILRGSDKWNLSASEEPRTKMPRTKEGIQKKTKNQRKNTKNKKSQGLPNYRSPCDFIFGISLVLGILASWFLISGHLGSCFLPHYPTFAAKIEIKL